MRGRVALIGCRGVVLRGWDGDVVRMSPDALHRRSLADYAAIVLGVDAIERVDIDRQVATLSRVKSRVILCVDACTGAALAAWVRRGFDDVVATRDLAAHLAATEARAARPPVEPRVWLPCLPVAGTSACVAVDAVDRLEQLTVQDWAAAVGWSRGHLLTTCREAFGRTPKELLQCLLLATYADLRQRGEALQACAAALGYFDGSTLLRAIRRARAADTRSARQVQTATEPSANGHFQAA